MRLLNVVVFIAAFGSYPTTSHSESLGLDSLVRNITRFFMMGGVPLFVIAEVAVSTSLFRLCVMFLVDKINEERQPNDQGRGNEFHG